MPPLSSFLALSLSLSLSEGPPLVLVIRSRALLHSSGGAERRGHLAEAGAARAAVRVLAAPVQQVHVLRGLAGAQRGGVCSGPHLYRAAPMGLASAVAV